MTRLIVLSALLFAALAGAARADVPQARALYHDGPDGRYLLGGRWDFKLDPNDKGLAGHWFNDRSATGWSATTVPNAWNATDESPASMAGSIGWYRKDFTLPSASAAFSWVIRFESVNYRTRVYLNGRRIGTNRGAYIPFEFDMRGVLRRGVNHLAVRVDSRRRPTDFPPSGITSTGAPTGGWWNYGGITREVYLRRISHVDFKQVIVRPDLPCGTCAATVDVITVMRNMDGVARRVGVTGSFGSRRLNLGATTLAPHGVHELSTRITIAHPALWSPATPSLYNVRLRASTGGGYALRSGIRSIKVSNGHLFLNGQPMSFRGVGYHEDSRTRGFAITDADREWLVSEAKAVGATVMRTHYPPHPYLQELADREGMLLWSEIPVYSVKTRYLKRPLVRDLALKELERNIDANQNHPSVMLWSIANELSSKPGPSQGYYIKRAAHLAHELDPTRPVGIALAAYPSAGCQPEYAPLDVIGVNEYFGWYPGPGGQTFDREKLSPYLDSVHDCYADKALVITEFGAEANRDGPVEEKGTYLFQQDFVNYHLGVYASKPWLSGAIYWALQEFRVRPGWEGGNPRPHPPLHEKGVVRFDGSLKPAYFDLQRLFRGTQQIRARGARRGR